MKTHQHFFWLLIILCVGLLYAIPAYAQEMNPNPPEQPVKLIFIHHSTGENWLRDGYGNLGRTLADNNYFVSDTNYGWGPDGIGDRTDIPNWLEWFGEQRNENALTALYQESAQNSADITRTLSDPGGENEVILFKSCFPNSDLGGNPNDPPTPGEDMSVGNAKFVYQSILPYFASRPDKMFVAITAPPLSDATHAQNARAFNQWLLNDWLAGYEGNNVFVFDFFTVLTGTNNHHRYNNGKIEHVFSDGKNTSLYASAEGDDHPNVNGSQKATGEFVPLLNIFYHQWKAKATSQAESPTIESPAEPAQDAPQQPSAPTTVLLINDFESGNERLEHYISEGGTQIKCEITSNTPYEGKNALQVEYQITPDGWIDCSVPFENGQNWGQSKGISFFLRSDQPDTDLTFHVLCGLNEQAIAFEVYLKTSGEWTKFTFAWDDFIRAPWADVSTLTKVDTTNIISYGLSMGTDVGKKGNIWLDNVSLVPQENPTQIEAGPTTQIAAGPTTQIEAAPAAQIEPTLIPEKPAEKRTLAKLLPCAGGLLPLAVGLILVKKKKSNRLI